MSQELKPNALSADLIKEWHPTLNTKLPTEVTSGMGYKATWLCENNHIWDALVFNRTKGSGCPYCTGKKVEVGVNDFATLFPELASEWHPTLNTKQPHELGKAARYTAIWLCPIGHTYPLRMDHRTNDGHGCHFCSGQKTLTGFNDLATLQPELAAQWHPTLNSKLPSEVTMKSAYKAYWICPEGHDYPSMVFNRTSGKGCSICSGNLIVAGVNDLVTLKPEWIPEWHPTLNTKLMSKLTVSSNYRAHWVCDKGHTYEANLNNRSKGDSCSTCSKKQTSKSEELFRDWFTLKFSDVNISHRQRTVVAGWLKPVQLDITGVYKGQNVVVEYDGVYYHDRPKKRLYDTELTEALLTAGYIVVRIREDKLPHLDISHPNLLQVSHKHSLSDAKVDETGVAVMKFLFSL